MFIVKPYVLEMEDDDVKKQANHLDPIEVSSRIHNHTYSLIKGHLKTLPF